jgi:NAD dependent epimerase/dehydratase
MTPASPISGRYLVTGAAGFIGSHLVESLVRQGAQVRAFVHYSSRPGHGNLDLLPGDVRGSIEVVAGDVTDASCIDEAVAGCDVVLHLAAIISIPHSYRAAARCLAVNGEGTLRVLEACRRHGVRRLVHTSTSEVYGSARAVPMSEAHPIAPQSPYAATKVAADALVMALHRSFGVPAVIVRPFNTYGPRQSPRAVLPSIVAQLVSGANEIQLGDLRPTRDFVHVDDTVAGFLAAARAEAAVGGVFNLATGRETSIGDAARLAMRVVGREAPIRQVAARARPETSEVVRLCGDATAARTTLGWTPTVALEEGLAAVADFVRRHPDRYRPLEQFA